MSPNKDRTGNERQQRRRVREKEWLAENGFNSWEALHTALLSGKARLTPREPDKGDSSPLAALSNSEHLPALGDLS